MDPLLDEKFLLALSRVVPEYLEKNLKIEAKREAFGPSKNEGLCYENASKVEFIGDVKGHLYMCMDGYTKLKLLPKIAESFMVDPTSRTNAPSILLEFANQFSGHLLREMQTDHYSLDLLTPENLNNKLVPIDLNLFREYILIFFLKDPKEKSYLGRMYFILLLQKY